MPQNNVNSPYFLRGDGEMIRLIREKDWSGTVLGTFDQWPLALRVMLNAILNSRYPKFLWWGPELICFYNDAYRPSLGAEGKHPVILGMPAEEAWAEIWDVIHPLIRDVWETGKATWSEDQLIPIYRNQALEDVYWTFSYSPVMDEEGIISGVMVTCTETTEKVKTRKQLEESNDQLQFAIDSAELGTWDYNPMTRHFTANARMRKWMELPPEGEIRLETAIDKIRENDRERVVDAIQFALLDTTGGKFDIEFAVPNLETREDMILRAIGKVWFDENNTAYRFTGTLHNVTERVLAAREIISSAERFRMMADNISQLAWMADKKGYIYWYNKRWYDYTGTTLEDMQGWGWMKVHHPDHVDRVVKRIQHSWDTGEYWEDTFPLRSTAGDYHWFLSRAIPIRDEQGQVVTWFGTNTDITREKSYEQFLEESEEKRTLVLESSGLGTWEVDFVNGKVAYSDKYLEILGLTPGKNYAHQELIGRVHPDDLELRHRKTEEAMRSGTLDYQARVLLDDKSVRWFRALGKVFYDAEGNPTRMLGTIQDITKEKSHQEELEKREARFSHLANAMPQLVWEADQEGRVFFYNKRVSEFGARQLPSGEWKWDIMIHPEDLERTQEKWSLALQTGSDYNMEHRIRMKDGSYRWFLSRAYPQKNENGRVIQWIGTATDIDEIKMLEQRKDEFIKMASHELKTPITSIKGYLQLLQETYQDDGEPVLQQFIRTLNRQIGKLTNLIADLLDVTRIESGELTIHKTVFDINDLVSETAEDIRSYSRKHRIRIEQEEGLRVNADKERMAQVLINLLTNAVKYSPDADEVLLSIRKEGERVVISVKDFGIGIEPGEEKKIFQNFYRAKGRDEQTFPGFGIGLFVVNEILRHHEGEIWVKSEKNKGSEFSFSLPLYN